MAKVPDDDNYRIIVTRDTKAVAKFNSAPFLREFGKDWEDIGRKALELAGQSRLDCGKFHGTLEIWEGATAKQKKPKASMNPEGK